MVFYNKCAAFMLAETGKGVLRTQSEPDAAKLTRFTAICPDAAHLASSAAI